MKTYTATFSRQLFPWSVSSETTREIQASSKKRATKLAQQYAEQNTHEFDVQGGGRSFVGKMELISVK